MICHVCEENATDFTCQICGEPVCEDCCIVPTYMNQLDYALCTVCEDGNQSRRMADYEKEAKIQESIAARKKAIQDKRHATYWKPENVAKRKAAKIERKRLRAEQARQQFEQAFKMVAEMFRR